MNKIEIQIKNYALDDACYLLVDLDEGRILEESCKQDDSALKSIITKEVIQEDDWDVVEFMDSKGYEFVEECGAHEVSGIAIERYFEENCPVILFSLQTIDITYPFTNKKVSEIGEPFRICGSDEAILYDGDLEEFLKYSYAGITDVLYFKDVEHDEFGSVSNYEEHEVMGFVEVTQGLNIRYFKLICGRFVTESLEEYIDFSKSYRCDNLAVS